MGSTLSTLSSALTKDSESADYNGSPSERDVDAVREYFLQFLPLELIDLVLDYAEYWPCLRVDTNKEIDALASRTISGEATWLYLISPFIPPREIKGVDSRHRRIRKVKFDMESNDQGWGGEPEHRGPFAQGKITLNVEFHTGTYNGSWSWFEAIIFRASASPCWLDLDSDPFNLGSSFNANDIKELFPEPIPNGWHIQSNVVASDTPRFHSVSWTEFPEESEDIHVDPTSQKGREGLGHELVQSLEPGDRVMLIAKAKFPNWENHVYSASIEIFYSV
ncbi:hypothetical protein GYMLUDRAFT_50129 [Collybiopsis luxurians FD-317 M1]|uniref:Uncharacterized protein n=1 Tax=Collybiopsis luxurians FD-317 M1 TaxID=944289 RepID=A0A0D0C2J6_9AGAR|nr:hypothetical protein GYMLUDRAFT_50129 [Collybiopsis luxurians FD-317 M1]